MDAKDILLYGGLGYLLYRLTRPAEAESAVPAEPAVLTQSTAEGVPAARAPELTVVGQSQAAPPQQTLFAPAPPVYPVAPPVEGFATKLVDTNVGIIRVPESYTAYDLYALGYNRPLEAGRQPTQIQYAVS